MQKIHHVLIGTLLACSAMIACKKNQVIPTPEADDQLSISGKLNHYFEDQIQQFSVEASLSTVLYGSQGTRIELSGNNFADASGNPLTGNVDIQLAEIYTPVQMILTKKVTLGNNGGANEIIGSGGEFMITVTQNGNPVNIINPVNVSTAPSNSFVPNMELFNGDVDGDGNVIWTLDNTATITNVMDSISQQYYYQYLFYGDFDWINCDYFWSSTGPQTTCSVTVPSGYDDTNTICYVVFTSDNAVANFSNYNAGVFSPGNYTLPEGLSAHFVLIADINGQLQCAIQQSTITTNHNVTFTSLTDVGSMTELESILEAAL